MKGVRCDWNDDVHVVNSWATWTSPLQSQPSPVSPVLLSKK